MVWRNGDGYFDPTAGEAFSNVAREEREKAWKPCVFICSPFAGDIAGNTEKARRYMRFAMEQGAIPFAPHLLYPQALDEENPDHRQMGLFFGLVWLGKCHELWVFGDAVSGGMAAEIAKAAWRHMPIRRFTENCEKVVTS